MSATLKACRNCGGKCDPKGWMRGDGLQGPECECCGITTPDVESWSRLMGGQDTSQWGEAVAKVSAWQVDPWYATDPSKAGRNIGVEFLGDHAKTLVDGQPLYTHPADQVAEPGAELVALMGEVRKRCQLPDWARIRIDALLAKP